LTSSIQVEIGNCFAGIGDKKTANEYFLKALEVEPRCPDANFFIGRGLMKDDDFVAAQKYFREVIEVDTHDVDASDAMHPEWRKGETTAHYCLFRCLMNQGDLSGAEAICHEVIKIESNRGKDWAIKCHTYHSYDEDHHSGYCKLGECLYASGNLVGACEAYETAVQRKCIDADSLTDYARCLREKDPVNETQVSQLLCKASKFYRQRISRVSKLESREAAEGSDYLAANKDYSKKRSFSYSGFGDCLCEQEKFSAANSAFREADKSEPGNLTLEAILKDYASDDDDSDDEEEDCDDDNDDPDVINDESTEETGQDFLNDEYDDDDIIDSEEEEYDFDDYEDYDESRERDMNDFDYNFQNLTRD
jgi:tetratricopeptide (TPR) repeat protein